MEKFEPGSPQEKKDNGFMTELLALAHSDQDARRHWQETGETWEKTLDKRNTERLKEIVAKIGWPTQSKVGEEAANAAWLLVQHADHDPEFQQQCLDLMQHEPDGEVRKQDRAFLEDRVRVSTGRPTLYGTQFDYDSEGKFGPVPIEDRENLNTRRKEMGLGLFEEYELEMKELNQKIAERTGRNKN
ncbi:MAG: hypothetical protein KBB77_02045 [Candidatus Moranbacteria bacterium]|nr:hypothetical protein [Candidatus Moranbacteria bacterium]